MKDGLIALGERGLPPRHIKTALLLLGESIPDLPYWIVGQRISGDEAEELGYREYAKYGGWMIWHLRGDDWYIIDISEPTAWFPVPALASPSDGGV
jgi:hypothetical protein